MIEKRGGGGGDREIEMQLYRESESSVLMQLVNLHSSSKWFILLCTSPNERTFRYQRRQQITRKRIHYMFLGYMLQERAAIL